MQQEEGNPVDEFQACGADQFVWIGRKKMRLVITADVDLEESGLNPDEVKDDIVQFARDLLVIGASEQEIGLTLREVEYSD